VRHDARRCRIEYLQREESEEREPEEHAGQLEGHALAQPPLVAVKAEHAEHRDCGERDDERPGALSEARSGAPAKSACEPHRQRQHGEQGEHIAGCIDFVRRNGVRTIYYETLVSPAVAETVARETGARTAVLDPIEGITADSPGRDYFAIMAANLTSIREGQPCP